MSDFNLDKKKEHERLADEALAAGDFAKAYAHVVEAVRYTAALAGRCNGVLRKAYVSNADQLLDVAERIKAKAEKASSKLAEKAAKAVRTENADGTVAEEGEETKAAIRHDTGIRLADVKGLEEAKQTVKQTLINPVKYPKACEKLGLSPGKGLLLYGPPGTGKTMFARAIAGELDLPFIYRRASELKDKYVGGSEKNTVQMFKEAYSHKQSLLFLDECDAILSSAGNQKANIVTSFIAELDGFETYKDSHVFVLLATNKPWMIDSRVLQRIGAAVYVGLPDAEVRRDILSAALANRPLAADVNIDELVTLTDGFSGRELAGGSQGLCNMSKAIALNRWIAKNEASAQSPSDDKVDIEITRDDFMEALKRVVPETKSDPTFLKRNLEWSLGRRSPTDSDDKDED